MEAIWLNAGAATVQGVEVQLLAAPVDPLTLRMNIGYLHPIYNKYQSTVCSNVTGVTADCSGLPFPFAPKVTLSTGADYTVSLPNGLGSVTVGGDVNYKSEVFVSDPPFPSSRQGGYALFSATLTYKDPSQKYSVDLYGTNLGNKQYTSEFTNSGGLETSVLDGRPREFGVRVQAKFGE